MIQLIGDEGQTDERILSTTGFDRGSEKVIDFKDKDVGRLTKIKVFHSNPVTCQRH